MYFYRKQYVKSYVNGTGITAGKTYFVVDGNFDSFVIIDDDDHINHRLSLDFLLNNAECLYTYCIVDGNKTKEVDHIKVDKRMIDAYIIESLFDFRGYTDNEETALRRILNDLFENGIGNYSMSKYAQKVYSRMLLAGI